MLVAIDSPIVHAPSPVAQSLMNTYRIGVGGLFSAVYGVLPIAPQLALGVAGLGLIALVHRSGSAIVAAVVVYEFVVSPFGFRGYALPGRFQIVLIPLLALAIGLLLATYPRVVLVFAATVVVGSVFLIQGGRQPTYGGLYDDGGRPNLPALRAVSRAFPDFSLASGHTGASIRGSQFRAPSPQVTPTVLSPVLSADTALRRGRYEAALTVHTSAATGVTVTVDSDAAKLGVLSRTMTVHRPVDGDGTVRFAFGVGRSGTRYRFGVTSTSPPVVVQPRLLSIHAVSGVEARTAPSRRDLPFGLAWMLVALASSVAVFLASRNSPATSVAAGRNE